MKSVTTPKGTVLPLISLKGKDYLQVMHRLQWFNESVDSFDIQTTIFKAEKDESIVTSKVSIFDSNGRLIKSSSATKREDAKGFGDHLEKAETGSIGRALALLGFGTQFAISDLDEGVRIVDSPVPVITKPSTPPTFASNPVVLTKQQEDARTQAQFDALGTTAEVNKPSFRKKPKDAPSADVGAVKPPGDWI